MALSDPRILLDGSTPFDDAKVALLDQVVAAMFGNTDTHSRDVAHKVLGEFKNMPEAWSYVAVILNKSRDANTKFVALQILENTIQTRWNILPEAERNGIKVFVTDLVIRLASDERTCQTEKHFVNKVNENLIQIVKQEWPDRWPGFITELCQASKVSQSICENNMRLLNMLSEEVFDFGRTDMVSKKVEKLAGQLTAQFQEVFDVCTFILKSYVANPAGMKESLVQQTLKCLAHFLKWIPLGFVFETDLIESLLNHFWEAPQFRADCLRCLTEIASLQLSPDGINMFRDRVVVFWLQLVNKVLALPPQTLRFEDVGKVPPQMRLFWETIYCQLSLCLTAFLKNHRETIAEPLDKERNSHACVQMLQQLALMTDLQHEETFHICLEFWFSFAEKLLNEVHDIVKSQNRNGASQIQAPLMLGSADANIVKEAEGFNLPCNSADLSWRVKMYSGVLNDVRKVMIKKMAKPQEVYIQFDQETGEVTRDHEVDTAEVALYNTMRCTQVLLTNLGQEETEAIMLETLNAECMQAPVQLGGWNPTALNRLCYSIGSISGAMREDIERRFLVQVIRNLLNLCELMKEKDDKAIVASNIMYVVGQYPRFLKAHWKFLKTVVHKLFEFMHETFPGVQDMACETFLKVAQKCKQAMAATRPEEPEPFIMEIIANHTKETEVLDEKQNLLFFEAVARVISATPETMKAQCVMGLMEQSNATWKRIMEAAKASPDTILYSLDVAKRLVYILRINQRVAKAIGAAFTPQLMILYQEMMQVYALYSQRILQEVQRCGPSRIKHSEVKVLHLYKRETLHLLETFINTAAQEGPRCRQEIAEKLLSDLLQPVLTDYKNNIPDTRDCEVLTLLSVLMARLDSHISPVLPAIFEFVFEVTLDMIKIDFQSYPDHREKFYEMLKACNQYCFDGLFALPSNQLKAYVESLVWAFKHEHPSVAEQGLQVTYEFLLKLINEKREVLPEFCNMFYFSLMKETLLVLTDTLHRSGFKFQTLIFMHLLRIVEFGVVHDASKGLDRDNVMQSLIDLLSRSFQTVNKKQVEAFVLDLFNYCRDQKPARFQQHIRDFLISLKEFAGDNDPLFEAEREEALARARELERQRQMQVPGMIAQYDTTVTVRGDDD